MRDANVRCWTPDNTDRRPLALLASPIDPNGRMKLAVLNRQRVAARRAAEERMAIRQARRKDA
ncbi:hypothetical protein CXB49_10460 [Chromobacterium sp. ATCC 53434]|uniref:hypothetical protein n=1 Tax=Chromobacterium sp. (strain ATCC 53434 / SC 14030) TaxID=2059672 RepID=UPI000C7891B9|nr:hypothetical protein [Chromobacterium sp. ATCC 53434]AUH51200.1 hypothetical protein CXB49_10460 [Chromobacterium sp. ATCC 53434]